MSIPNYQWTIIFAIIAMIFGSYAFNHFERAAQFRPTAPIVYELPLFTAKLKTGNSVEVTLELHYPSAQDAAYSKDRIKVQLQRALNVYLSKAEALSADPYSEIDDLLQKAMEPLRQDLGLDQVSLKTINVQTLSDHFKSGQRLSLQNRPTGLAVRD
jgi:hypothetical protein